MRIAIMGSGGMGGFYGGCLAKQGRDATFIARGAHLEAIRANGLPLRGPDNTHTIKPAKVTDDPSDRCGRYRIVLRKALFRGCRGGADQAIGWP